MTERTGLGEQGPGDLARGPLSWEPGEGRKDRRRREPSPGTEWEGRRQRPEGGSHTAKGVEAGTKGREEAGVETVPTNSKKAHEMSLPRVVPGWRGCEFSV